jgi:hypothetical protein
MNWKGRSWNCGGYWRSWGKRLKRWKCDSAGTARPGAGATAHGPHF